MKIYIKNMVCNRCIAAVKGLLDRLELEHNSVQLGEVELQSELDANKKAVLKQELESLGFELLDDSRQRIIEKIKNVVIQHIHHSEEDNHLKMSELLVSVLHKDYSSLSRLFSEVEGTTIEKYVINQKVEKVKELLVYDELSLSEIAFRLGYSSVAHLSAQFKKVTGLTPSHFKKMSGIHRRSIDQI